MLLQSETIVSGYNEVEKCTSFVEVARLQPLATIKWRSVHPLLQLQGLKEEMLLQSETIVSGYNEVEKCTSFVAVARL